jgi:hypothetical protein
MKNLTFVFACLLSLNVFAQRSPADSLHTHDQIHYNFESHKSSTIFKYVGRAISSIGAFAYYKNASNGADQEKLNSQALIIVAGGLMSLFGDLRQDVEEVNLGKVVRDHLTENQNDSYTLQPYELINNAEGSKNSVILIGPRNLDPNREIIYTDKKGAEYIATIILYNPSSYCYVIEYEKNGKQKVVSVYKNKHHLLSQK